MQPFGNQKRLFKILVLTPTAKRFFELPKLSKWVNTDIRNIWSWLVSHSKQEGHIQVEKARMNQHLSMNRFFRGRTNSQVSKVVREAEEHARDQMVRSLFVVGQWWSVVGQTVV